MMVLCKRVCGGAPKCPHHHQTHQTPRPRSSTREFDVSLDCVRLSGLTLRCPDRFGVPRSSEHHFFVLNRLSRTHNDLRAPQRLGAALVESTGWGFQAKIGLWGGFEEPIFWGSVSRFSGAWQRKSSVAASRPLAMQLNRARTHNGKPNDCNEEKSHQWQCQLEIDSISRVFESLHATPALPCKRAPHEQAVAHTHACNTREDKLSALQIRF